MPVITFCAPAVTVVTAMSAAHRPAPAARRALELVGRRRVHTVAVTIGLPSPARSARGPPMDALFRIPSPGRSSSASAFFISLFHRTTGHDMSLDIHTSEKDQRAQLRASLSEQFALQTVRLKELTEISADTGDPGEAHNLAALLTDTRRNLEQIVGALRRIADGSYGLCEKCEAPIPAERLEVLPHARFCVPCQQKHAS
jgi:DnaK suppressor protein